MSQPRRRTLGGRYELGERLGSGGFGAVHEALDLELQRRVAVKILDPRKEASTPREVSELTERFQREAVSMAAIAHPNVVTVFDVGVAGAEVFIVMEFLAGRSLSEELERWPRGMPAQRALPLVVGALRGLGAGHDLGIVHKDLKPDNLYLTGADGSVQKLAIIDFGVARVLHEQKLTATGKLVGTPRYLAPEYIEKLEVTPALDVYQMGLILVEMLSGVPCIPRRLDLVTCCQRHVDGELQIPEGLRFGAIGAVVARATDVDPTKRYRDAADFADALAEVDPDDVRVAGPGEHPATPRLGVAPLPIGTTQQMHGAAVKREVRPSPEPEPARPRHARTGPTKRLGPAREVLEQLQQVEPKQVEPKQAEPKQVEPDPPDPPAKQRVRTIEQTLVIDTGDPRRAQRLILYGLLIAALIAVAGTAAFFAV